MTSQVFISPTEPVELRALGTTSLIPERYGVDVMWSARKTWHGFQRKEFKDLLASVQDGRLTKELAQMRIHIPRPMIVIEGDVRFTTDGNLIVDHWGGKDRWTEDAWLNLLLSIVHEGAHIERTRNLRGTIAFLNRYLSWSAKEHYGLKRRGGTPGDAWGRVTNRETALWLLQGLPDVGPKLAEAILEHFGRVPFDWSIDVHQLTQVKGIGKPTAIKLIETFQQVDK